MTQTPDTKDDTADGGAFGRWFTDEYGLPAYEYTCDQAADPRAAAFTTRGTSALHWHQIGNDRLTVVASNRGDVQALESSRGLQWLCYHEPRRLCPGGGIAVIKSEIRSQESGARSQQNNIQDYNYYPSPEPQAPRPSLFNPQSAIRNPQSNSRAWCDLYSPGAPAAGYRRIFGAFYFRKIHEQGGLRTDHRIIAPRGGLPLLFCELLISNTSGRRATAAALEVFGVRLHYISADVLVMPPDREHFGVSPLETVPAGLLRALRAHTGTDTDSLRRRFGDSFHFNAVFLKQEQCLVQTPRYLGRRSPEDEPAGRNYYPQSIFLAALDHKAELTISNMRELLGPHPELFSAAGLSGDGRIAVRRAPCLGLGVSLTLEPGETRRLTFAYGYAHKEQIPHLLERARDRLGISGDTIRNYKTNSGHVPEIPRATDDGLMRAEADRWKEALCFFEIPQSAISCQLPVASCQKNTKTKHAAPKTQNPRPETPSFQSAIDTGWLTREAPWHSAYTRGAALYDDYYQCRYLPQGGAYEYLHGLRGAVRDLAFFTIPLVYMDPRLAREIIEFRLRLQTPDGRIMYTSYGFGRAGGALVHSNPTDLQLFLLWALTEYLFFTRDFEFLDKEVPFYPRGAGQASRVRDRVKLCLDYLFERIGIGAHGLLRVGDGDWSDGISLFVSGRRAFIRRGESAFNTAMALYVLPRVAGLLKRDDPAAAATLHGRATALRDALLDTWTGKWFPRGFDGRGRAMGRERLFLEHHAWLLIARCLPPDMEQSVLRHVRDILDTPAPFGQMILYPAANTLFNFHEKGWDVNGGVWYAMNFLLAWGYAQTDPELGLATLRKNSCARRAEVYPEIWYGLWTGPDAYNAHYSPRPGETYFHVPTPATDWPAQNMNLHACFLMALIKLCGIEPDAGGLELAPRMPLPEYTLRLPALDMRVTRDRIHLNYKAGAPASVRLRLDLKDKWIIKVEKG